MYLNPSGIRSMGHALKFLHQLIANWFENAGKTIEQEILNLQMTPHNISILEMDELHTLFRYYQKHIVSKAETCLAEAEKSSLRDMLSRLNRRTKRFSKSLRMLRYSVWLWMKKEGALLSIYC